MTVQIQDTVEYAGDNWSLAGANGERLFVPGDFGLHTRPTSSACWRGFICHYAVRDRELRLDQVNLALVHEPPAVLGCQPQQFADSSFFTVAYRDLGHVIEFTGGLLLADEFLGRPYAQLGLHPAWKYANVIEVELDAGHVIRVEDRSQAMAELRRTLAGADGRLGLSKPEVRARIDRVFSHRYCRQQLPTPAEDP